jgi:hypothetical protein
MDAICRKCGRPYQAKRKTSKYCKKSCRSAYNQQVKRGQAPANSLTNDEGFLLEIVLEIAGLAATIWAEQQAGATRLSVASFEHLQRCAQVESSIEVKLLKERYETSKRLEGRKFRAKKPPLKPKNAPEAKTGMIFSSNN